MAIKKESKEVQESPKQRRYIRPDRVKEFEKNGWKVVKGDFKDMGLSDAARQGVIVNNDLVLVVK